MGYEKGKTRSHRSRDFTLIIKGGTGIVVPSLLNPHPSSTLIFRYAGLSGTSVVYTFEKFQEVYEGHRDR